MVVKKGNFSCIILKIAVFRRNKTIINDIKQIESLTIIGKYTANAALPHLLHPSSLFLLSNTSHSRAQEIMTVTSGNLSYNTENYSKNTG